MGGGGGGGGGVASTFKAEQFHLHICLGHSHVIFII